jgi:molybdate transport system permease protein
LILLGFLFVPVVALALTASPSDIALGAAHPGFAAALWLSLWTSVTSLVVVVVTGTPLAWWLANTNSRLSGVVEVLVDLPLVLPPAVVGIALLRSFGRLGLFGPLLEGIGIQLAFTSWAVILAQVVVSAPFFVQAATTALREVDPELVLVARTLGASPFAAFRRVALPLALPGLLAGAALSWARSLGEFGATLLFAGSFPGTTRTMPVAIYAALETDLRVAVALALSLTVVAIGLLAALHFAPRFLVRRRAR